jgi:hypothetical protein
VLPKKTVFQPVLLRFPNDSVCVPTVNPSVSCWAHLRHSWSRRRWADVLAIVKPEMRPYVIVYFRRQLNRSVSNLIGAGAEA